MSRAQVMAYLRDGTLGESDLVWRPGFDDWVPLRELREFWTPPDVPERKAEALPLTLPQADAPAKQLDEKWSLWGVATWGLVLSSAVLWMGALTTRSFTLANIGYMPNAGLIGALISELFSLPVLFVLIAMIRNTVRRRSLRPSSVSAGWRAAAFFGILIAIGLSLRIFGTLYFSRDEVIAGEARTDMVNSFVSDCMRSQRAMSSNRSITDAQIEGYCNCIASNLVWTLTYKQLATMTLDKVKEAVTAAAPSCRSVGKG